MRKTVLIFAMASCMLFGSCREEGMQQRTTSPSQRSQTEAPETGPSERRPYTVSLQQATINGIGFASTEKDIVAALGTPDSEVEGIDEPTGEPSKTLGYEGFSVYFVEDVVYSVNCFHDGCSTPGGVAIGDDRGKVLDIYGPGRVIESGDSAGERILYQIEESDAYLVFHLENGKVVEIELFFNYV